MADPERSCPEEDPTHQSVSFTLADTERQSQQLGQESREKELQSPPEKQSHESQLGSEPGASPEDALAGLDQVAPAAPLDRITTSPSLSTSQSDQQLDDPPGSHIQVCLRVGLSRLMTVADCVVFAQFWSVPTAITTTPTNSVYHPTEKKKN